MRGREGVGRWRSGRGDGNYLEYGCGMDNAMGQWMRYDVEGGVSIAIIIKPLLVQSELYQYDRFHSAQLAVSSS
jgi:hypothetical protein